MENLESCNQHERRICAEEGEGISIVKGRERRDAQVHPRTTEEKGILDPQSHLKQHQYFL